MIRDYLLRFRYVKTRIYSQYTLKLHLCLILWILLSSSTLLLLLPRVSPVSTGGCRGVRPCPIYVGLSPVHIGCRVFREKLLFCPWCFAKQGQRKFSKICFAKQRSRWQPKRTGLEADLSWSCCNSVATKGDVVGRPVGLPTAATRPTSASLHSILLHNSYIIFFNINIYLYLYMQYATSYLYK